MTDFFVLGAGRPFSGRKHTALQNISKSTRVLDWSLKAVKFLNPNCYFISGYQEKTIRKNYPNFKYLNNKNWRNTKAGWSLLNALPDDCNEAIVAYSDILFNESTVKELHSSKGDIVVAIDSQYKTRYVGRPEDDLERCEKVCHLGKNVNFLGSKLEITKTTAEFIGLVSFSKKAISKLQQLKATHDLDRHDIRQSNLSDLIELLRIQGLNVNVLDVKGNWAELNESADLAKFFLGSKAKTLSRLRALVKNSKIEKQLSFKVSKWQKDSEICINEIHNSFGECNLIIRSSAVNEDGFDKSSAGAYKSILNINSYEIKQLKNSINDVVRSYEDQNPDNEILIQPMIEKVTVSGVVLTRGLKNAAPYYSVNYDDVSGNTESITSGTSKDDKTLIIRRDAHKSNKIIPNKLRILIPAIKEIESLLGYDSLDIEFALTEKYGVHILQVRPIVLKDSISHIPDNEFYSLVDQAKKAFQLQQTTLPFMLGDKPMFGIMPDWNPAEIIGIKPTPLATSLYRKLILNGTWSKQRMEYGYRDVRPYPLLISFAGHPYIDIRASFNSFIPISLQEKIGRKLVNFSLNWLKDHPELHDKVEFDVIPTCYDLDFNRWEDRLLNSGKFSQSEVDKIRKAYLDITNKAFDRISSDLENIQKLDNRFSIIKKSKMPRLQKAMLLLDDSITYGTLPFAHLARSAFIAISVLKSALSSRIISNAEYDDFLNSISTVSKELARDADQFARGKISKDAFLKKYGHLRPGTYEITSQSYKKNPDLYLRPIVDSANDHKKEADLKVGTLWEKARHKIELAMNEQGLSKTIDEMEAFMRKSIEGREYAKFIFSRNLSTALDEITAWGKENEIQTKTISKLSIEDIDSLSKGAIYKNIVEWAEKRSQHNTESDQALKRVELPPLISREEDFSVFLYPNNHTNFIGSNSIIAKCMTLGDKEYNSSLEGSIVLIPQADPGYDWLFGCNISGLITMYGGANSHMAIRAAEFDLPAAIGVGRLLYRKLELSRKLELNPSQGILRVID